MQAWRFLVATLAVLVAHEHEHCVALEEQTASGASSTSGKSYSDSYLWAVEVDGDSSVADKVAADLGMANLGQIGGLKNYYHFVLRHDEHRSKRSAEETQNIIGKRMAQEHNVVWFEQQRSLQRSKREFLQARDYVHVVQNDLVRPVETSNNNFAFNDEQFPQQWYIQSSLADPRRHEQQIDLAVSSVWARGYSGKGIIVSVIDDGLEWNNTDLIHNYEQCASFDAQDFDNDPFPQYDATNSNRHGTRCGGTIAMEANNSVCGVGIAFHARVGGIRLLDGHVTDSKEAMALSHNLSCVQIYSNSWGPSDDGQTSERPGTLATQAMLTGVLKGRGGLGALYVFASGNGGANDDNCNCDGYVSSMYSISISSATQSGNAPYYAERCASTLATAYSSGSPGEPKVVSTDLHDMCTDQHGGTSAAAPIAAGIFALLLERNGNLTWRDVKHIVAWTARYEPLKNNVGWFQNGAGFWLNDAFGFGLLNAQAMIDLADPLTWINVPPMATCEIDMNFSRSPHSIGPTNAFVANISSSGCRNESNEVNFLEHVVLHVTMDYSRRGDIQIKLLSPMHSNVSMLHSRRNDESDKGLNDWPLTSVQQWAESPQGNWIVFIEDQSNRNNSGMVKRLRLLFHGTKEKPDHMTRLGPKRRYAKDVLIFD